MDYYAALAAMEAPLQQAGDQEVINFINSLYKNEQANQQAIAVQQEKDRKLAEAMASADAQRLLASLQGQLGQERETGVQTLKSELAARGLLDSGSLGAGIGSIEKNIQNILAQGTTAAENRRSDVLRELMAQTQQSNLARELQTQRLSYGAADTGRQAGVTMRGQDLTSTANLLGQQQGAYEYGNTFNENQFEALTNFLEGQRRYDKSFNEEREEFYANLGLKRDELTQQNKQFYDSLVFDRWKEKKKNKSGLLGALAGAGGTLLGSLIGASWLGKLLGSDTNSSSSETQST